MTDSAKGRSPPARILRALYEHRRWLDSDGRLGIRLGSGDEVFQFDALDLEGIDLSLGILNHSTFESANMRGAWLLSCALSDARFDSADVRRARFDFSEMFHTRMIGAWTTGATFEGLDRTNVIWTIEDDVRINRQIEEAGARWREEERNRTEAESTARRLRWIENYRRHAEEDIAAGNGPEEVTKRELKHWRTARLASLSR